MPDPQEEHDNGKRPTTEAEAIQRHWEDSRRKALERQATNKEWEEDKQKAAGREKLKKQQRQQRIKSHIISGAILFAVFHLILGFASSSTWSHMLLGAAVMTPVGAAAGYFISRRRYGPLGGAVVGTVLAVILLVIIRFILGGASNVAGSIMLFAIAVISGGLPGIFVGFHVQSGS